MSRGGSILVSVEELEERNKKHWKKTRKNKRLYAIT